WKASTVGSVASEATFPHLPTARSRHTVGAAVVARADTLLGIVSERDVVRGLGRHGPGLLSVPIADIMTTDVYTCTTEDTIEEVSEAMTLRRFRHVPVLSERRLAGIASIGDVVKSRLRAL